MIKPSKSLERCINDDKRTRPYRINFIWPLYTHLFQHGNFIFLTGNIGKKSMSPCEEVFKQLQKKSVDAVYTSPVTERDVFLEEKYDFHLPRNFALETISNTAIDPPTPGWMVTGESDKLIYSFIWLKDIVDTFMKDFQWLKKWFWREESSHPEWWKHTMPDTSNHTLCRMVPVKDVLESGVPARRFLITIDGKIIQIPPLTPLGSIRGILEAQGIPFQILPSCKPDDRTGDLYRESPCERHADIDLWERMMLIS
jgi:hypothetical protein